MKSGITVNAHKSVGSYTDLYDHSPIVFIQEREGEGKDMDITESVHVCLDCGWTDADIRTFAHEDCNREDNRVRQTFREYVEQNGYPE